MEAHIEQQKALAEGVIASLYDDVNQMCDKILEYARTNGLLVVPDGVRAKENQFHRYYLIGMNFADSVAAFMEAHPEVNQEPRIIAYNTHIRYNGIWICTLVNGFYPIRNNRFLLPVGRRDKTSSSEIADLIYLCQRAYNPSECSEWPEIRSQIRKLMPVCCKGHRPSTNTDTDVGPKVVFEAPATVFWDVDSNCVISQEKCLLISSKKRSAARLALSKSRWPGFLTSLRENRPDCSIKTTANTGRVPWDIRQESLLVEIDGKKAFKLYNNQDYELVPYFSRNGQPTADFTVYLRCILMDIYLFEILDKQTDFLYQELTLAGQQLERLDKTGSRSYSGVNYPSIEYEQTVRLDQIRARRNKNLRSYAEALENDFNR